MLRLISYLAPSIPAEFFELLASEISGVAGVAVDLAFETSISGPLPGDPNPFAEGAADLGFVCAPTYRWLRDQLDLLPVPVPDDPRAEGRPVYFADVVVRPALSIAAFPDLRGRRWAFNDFNSQSGWFSLKEKLAPLDPGAYFSTLIQSGSHLESIRMVAANDADAAAIDSNVLRNEVRRDPQLLRTLRTIDSWGPYPIQPVVMRSGLADSMKRAVRAALLRTHETRGEELRRFGFERFVDVEGSWY